MNAVGMSTAAALLVIGSLAAGEPIEVPQRAATWAAVAYLVAIGSVVVFVLYLVVLGTGTRRAPPTGSCSPRW